MSRNAVTVAALVALLVIGPAGCPPQTAGPTGTSLSDLNVQYYGDAASLTIATVTDNAGAMSVTVSGDRSWETGGLTSVAGTTVNGESFDVTFTDGAPSALETPSLSVLLTQIDASTYDVDVLSAESSKPAASGRQLALSPDLFLSYRQLHAERGDCKDSDTCSEEQEDKLQMLTILAYSRHPDLPRLSFDRFRAAV